MSVVKEENYRGLGVSKSEYREIKDRVTKRYWGFTSDQCKDIRVTVPVKTVLESGGHKPTRLMYLDWHDLYVVGDGIVTFYVGKSNNPDSMAWGRVYSHYHSNSTLGVFLRLNRDKYLKIKVTFYNSNCGYFAEVENDTIKAEQFLIKQLHPCFNQQWNSNSSPVPREYVLPPRYYLSQVWE